MCARKHILVTCSLDKTVRIWNYDRNELEVEKSYSDVAQRLVMYNVVGAVLEMNEILITLTT